MSASVTPVTWDYLEVEHRFVCGFEGDLVCRVQRVSVEERCTELGGR